MWGLKTKQKSLLYTPNKKVSLKQEISSMRDGDLMENNKQSEKERESERQGCFYEMVRKVLWSR